MLEAQQPTGDALVAHLTAIWSSVLETGDIDATTDFVDMGGTSLTAMAIRGRIRSELAWDADILDIIDHPTPQALAAVLPESEPWSEEEQ
ncbi:acyl carrier protein [Streptomyces mesophilus]|uniref:acyl carrier protein n=1 Tax=Streptomyces mesophilus TaxID=1775132 RepID=UPI00331C3891